MAQCYDVLGDLHVRVHMVDDQPGMEPMATVLRMTAQAHRPAEVKSERDVLAWLGEELIEMAHADSPLL